MPQSAGDKNATSMYFKLSKDLLIRARRFAVLRSLSSYTSHDFDKCARPMDIGAWNASHHSHDLKFMVGLGLVGHGKPYYWGGHRYYITPKGLEVVSLAPEHLRK